MNMTYCGDNELICRRLMRDSELTKTFYPGADVMKMTAAECANFIEFRGRELLNRYKMVEHIDVLESKVPEKLRHGYARFVVRLPGPISTKKHKAPALT